MEKKYIQITSGRSTEEWCCVDVWVMGKLIQAAKAQQDREVWMNHNTLVRGNPVQKFRGDL